MTKVIHIRDKIGSSDEVYIGRGSKWGNPFIIGQQGTRAEVISMYREYAKGFHKDGLEILRGKTLVCYCKPQACHGDVLIELLGNDDDS
jgi:hypothetical protein